MIPTVPGGVGYDHNYCFGKTGWQKHMARYRPAVCKCGKLHFALSLFLMVNYITWISFRVEHPASGRFLEMYSTEPGVQFYTAYYLNETGKGGAKYEKFGAFCLEAQHYPDSPNKVSCRLSKIFNFLLGSGY